MSLDILNMSDEEVLKLDPSSFEDSTDQDQAEETTEDSGEGQADKAEAGDEGAEASDESSADQTNGENTINSVEDSISDEEESTATDSGKSTKGSEVKVETTTQTEKEPEKKEEQANEEVASVNYEAEYKKLMAPFTANGKEMSVKSVGEAVTLMQMGANYHKKMAALKPNLKLLKLLETNGLMSEEKLSYLIDLSNKDTGAINRLVKDSGIDPMDLSTEQADEYKPKVRPVNDKELELDAILEEIQDTPAYQRTLKVVGQDWDHQSRKIVADAPQLLKVINSHVQSGIYDMIVAEVERERVFGRLQGVPDLDAYRQVGDAIQARGGFAHLVSEAGNQRQQDQSSKAVVVQPKLNKADESRLNDKRRAAAPTKPASSSSVSAKDFNPLAMSDEEFAKLAKL